MKNKKSWERRQIRKDIYGKENIMPKTWRYGGVFDTFSDNDLDGLRRVWRVVNDCQDLHGIQPEKDHTKTFKHILKETSHKHVMQ